MEKSEQTIEQIAARIVAYYRQIIAIKKSQGIKTFVIDDQREGNLSLFYMKNKYDGQSSWRSDGLNISRSDNWNTLAGSFDAAFGEKHYYYVSAEALFKKISLMLSKEGVANYFDTCADGNNYFKKGDNCLYIVIP